MESNTGVNRENSMDSTGSGTETETELPLSSQEDFNYLRSVQPILSDERHSVMKQEQPDGDSSHGSVSNNSRSVSNDRNTYWKTGARVHQNFKQQHPNGKTLPPSTSSTVDASSTLPRYYGDYYQHSWREGYKESSSGRAKDVSLRTYEHEVDARLEQANPHHDGKMLTHSATNVANQSSTSPRANPHHDGKVLTHSATNVANQSSASPRANSHHDGKILTQSATNIANQSSASPRANSHHDGTNVANQSSASPREMGQVAPCGEIVVTPSGSFYTSSSIFVERTLQADSNGYSRGEATSSRSPASPNVEPAAKRMREVGFVPYREETNQNMYRPHGKHMGYGPYPCNDDNQVCQEGQISSTTASFIQDINTTPANQLTHAGKYMFSMEYETETAKPAKSCNYTFSKALAKVFVQIDKVVPFKFVTEIPLPAPNVEIRAYLVYKDIHSREVIVDRCPHHLFRQELPNPHHVMDTVDGHVGEHIQCPCTHRYITILKPGITNSNHKINSFCGNLRFRCTSSCRGGIDRRSILALFELYINNKFCGRSWIEVSICSSPGRDRLNQEDKLYRILCPELFANRHEDETPEVASEMKDTCFPAKGILKEGRSFEDDTFLIKVKGSKNAELVGRLAKQLNEDWESKNKHK